MSTSRAQPFLAGALFFVALASGCADETGASGPTSAKGPAAAAAPESSAAPAAASAAAAATTPAPELQVKSERRRPTQLDGVDLSSLARPEPEPLPVTGAPSTMPTVASKLVVEGSDTAKFGEVVEGDPGEHVFDLVIEGDEPVRIFEQNSTCGCTVGSMQLVAADGTTKPYVVNDVIPVGSKLRVNGTLRTEGKQGENHHTITLRHNGANRATLLHFVADVVPIFEIEPNPFLNFGELFTGETKSAEVHVSSGVLERFRIEVDSSFGLPPYLNVVVEPVGDLVDGRAEKWIVRGTLGGDAPPSLGGQQGLTVLIATDVPLPGAAPLPDGSERTRQITLHAAARVKPLVNALPSYLSFGAVEPGSPAERIFTIEFANDDFEPDLERMAAVRITAREAKDQALYDGLFETRVVPLENSRNVEVHISFASWPEERIGPFGGTVQVDVGHPTRPTIEVPFSGVSRIQPKAAGR
jgi:hypothetical protein